MLDGFESTDFLSHIDAPLETNQRDILVAQIRAELPSARSSNLHPRVRSQYTPKFSSAIEIEHDRIAKDPKSSAAGGIDISRYETLEAPEQTSPHSDEEKPELLRQWRETLQKAYTSSTYLAGRNTNLSLLETYGKNAWLIGNSRLEDVLRDLEKEIANSRQELEQIELERRAGQEAVREEMAVLEDTWKKGVRGIIEVQIAAGDLQHQILDKRRVAAGE